jgi:RNase P subunit RPR2
MIVKMVFGNADPYEPPLYRKRRKVFCPLCHNLVEPALCEVTFDYATYHMVPVCPKCGKILLTDKEILQL